MENQYQDQIKTIGAGIWEVAGSIFFLYGCALLFAFLFGIIVLFVKGLVFLITTVIRFVYRLISSWWRKRKEWTELVNKLKKEYNSEEVLG